MYIVVKTHHPCFLPEWNKMIHKHKGKMPRSPSVALMSRLSKLILEHTIPHLSPQLSVEFLLGN